MRTALALLLLASQAGCTPRGVASKLPAEPPKLPPGTVRVFTPVAAAATSQRPAGAARAPKPPRAVVLGNLSLTLREADATPDLAAG